MANPYDGQVDSGASDFFFSRLLRFYGTLNMISAFISGLSVAILTFNEFHPAFSERLRVAGSLLVISISASVTSIVVTSILLFGFEGHERVTWNDKILASTPLITLDCSVLAFIMGLLLWSADNNAWQAPVSSSAATIFLLIIAWAAIKTYSIISRTGEPKKERKSS